ncbi:MAG: Fe-S cluster assembly protein SufD [Acidimicrobiia bacterium]|nr:Fe-S cluster assembly protein SufD [Acidimicrobiia bacterium]
MKTLDSQAAAAAGAADSPWRADRRATAVEYYEKLDMPSPSEEVWRYVDLDFALDDYQITDASGDAHELGVGIAASLPQTAGSLLIVDGHVVDAESGSSGAVFGSLRGIMGDQPDLLAPYVGARIPADLDKFAAAHAAFGSDGAALVVPRGVVVEEPFFIDVQAATSGTVAFPHIALAAEESSQASVVVRYRSDDDIDALVVPQLELSVAANANLKVTVVQHWGRKTRSIGYANAVVGRDGNVHLGEAGVGALFSRLYLNVDLEGDGSSANIVGAYFGDESQTLDYRYFMHHAGLNTDSDMFLKGAVQDESLSVFTGMIRIDEGAQKTNAYQTNRNLILSDGASAQSVPNLEILANDVRCGHGSTMGPLDDEQRYYLMSRGLDELRSNRLLVHGFFNEALTKFPEPAIAEVVASWIDAKYRAAQEAGRVK